jgi:pyruvate/2-oxoacid:ferredoxin oxidoreductase alpha subunit
MSNCDRTTIHITFQPPSRAHQTAEAARHERRLDDVPVAVADQMVADFRRYREERHERSPLYRYEQDGEEVIVALDLEEVVALAPAGATEGSAAPSEVS